MKARKARPVIAALSIALSVGLAPAGLSPTLAHAAGPVISGTVTLPTYVSSGSDAVPTQWTDQPAEWLVAPTDDSSIWSVEYDNACSTWSGDPVDDMGSVNLKSGGTFSFEPNAEAISAASTNCYQLMVYNSVSEAYMVFKLGAGDPASVGYITPGSDGSLSGVALDASSVAAPATLTTVSGNISGSGYNFTGWKVIYQPASCDNVQKTFGTSSFANVNGSTVGSGTFTVDVSSNYCYNIQFRDNAGEEENVKHNISSQYTPYLLTAGSNDLAFTRPATSDLTLNLSGLNTKHSYVLEISAYSSTPDGVSAEAVKTVDIEGNDASATVHVLSGMQYSVRLLDSNTRLYAPITITGGTPTPRNTEAHAWQEVSGGQTVVVAANDKGQTISGTVTGLTAPDGFKVKISVSEAGSRVEQGYAAITEGAFEHKTWANMSYSISLVRSDPEGYTIIPFLVDDDDDPDNNSPDDLVNLQSVAAADAGNLVLWAQNPAPYYEPKLTGYTEFGMVLTVDAVPEGYTATYTWYRVDSIDETDHTLLQSGSDKTSYTIVLGDVSHQIEVIVENITCSDTSCQGFADIENKSVLSDVESGVMAPDVSILEVKLDPNDLKVDTGVTPDFGEHDEYEEWASCVWKAAGTTISTSGCTYAPTADDLGKELTVDVTITKPNGGTDTAPTITVGTVKKADKIATDEWKVEISNLEPLVGDTVTAEISSGADGWTPAYQWKLTDKNG
ncbi:MAG: hypothetical protein LBR21_00175, partial [Propionibacteriaceae bacterium]|nr:hypothetical protein [Propionibacteriaceae bacterium]